MPVRRPAADLPTLLERALPGLARQGFLGQPMAFPDRENGPVLRRMNGGYALIKTPAGQRIRRRSDAAFVGELDTYHRHQTKIRGARSTIYFTFSVTFWRLHSPPFTAADAHCAGSADRQRIRRSPSRQMKAPRPSTHRFPARPGAA